MDIRMGGVEGPWGVVYGGGGAGMRDVTKAQSRTPREAQALSLGWRG